MAEEINIPPDNYSREEKYKLLMPQIKALLKGENDLIANMANIAAVLKSAFHFLWVGFYIVKSDQLVLGPFQGPVACTRIAKGKGVCGSAWMMGKSIIVPDVNEFPGHIACSPDSNSEIVVPGILKKRVIFVLDIDSAELNSFDEVDRVNLEMIVRELIPFPDV